MSVTLSRFIMSVTLSCFIMSVTLSCFTMSVTLSGLNGCVGSPRVRGEVAQARYNRYFVVTAGLPRSACEGITRLFSDLEVSTAPLRMCTISLSRDFTGISCNSSYEMNLLLPGNSGSDPAEPRRMYAGYQVGGDLGFRV